MATLRKYRLDRKLERSHSPERSQSMENQYNWKINRYQKANWGDIEAKEAHDSVVKYLWRKEYELNKKVKSLKKQISKQIESNENNGSESIADREVSSATETPLRGIHFRTVEDKAFERLSLIKSERKLADTGSYIEKMRSKANEEDEKITFRGKSAYQINAAILAEAEKSARYYKERRNERCEPRTPRRGIYEIMDDRNRLGIPPSDHRHLRFLTERQRHGDHDSRWKCDDYLNLVGYRMQNDRPRGFKMQDHGEIVW